MRSLRNRKFLFKNSQKEKYQKFKAIMDELNNIKVKEIQLRSSKYMKEEILYVFLAFHKIMKDL